MLQLLGRMLSLLCVLLGGDCVLRHVPRGREECTVAALWATHGGTPTPSGGDPRRPIVRSDRHSRTRTFTESVLHRPSHKAKYRSLVARPMVAKGSDRGSVSPAYGATMIWLW